MSSSSSLMALQPFPGHWPLAVQWSYTLYVGFLGWGISLYLHTGKHKHWIKVHIPREGFEDATPAFKKTKAVQALHRAATVTGVIYTYIYTYIGGGNVIQPSFQATSCFYQTFYIISCQGIKSGVKSKVFWKLIYHFKFLEIDPVKPYKKRRRIKSM
jgi:hypothetical protein